MTKRRRLPAFHFVEKIERRTSPRGLDYRLKRTGGDAMKIRSLKRLALALAVGGALSGCAVYAPPYAAYDGPYYPYGYGPAYVGPPVSLDFSYHEYDYRGGHGWHGRGGRRWR
jgi:hypothetical protein